MSYSTQAPRFHAMLQHVEEMSVLTMSKTEWLSLTTQFGKLVEIDIEQTPLKGVASMASLLAAVATRSSSGTGRVEIYRDDPTDAPQNVNKDEYVVWEDMQRHPQFKTILQQASTQMNPNFEHYLDHNVHFVKLPASMVSGHHSSELPTEIRGIIRSSSSSQ